MGDTSDGSSMAAQSAQLDPQLPRKRGLFGRMFAALSPSDAPQADEANQPVPLMPAAPMPGMLNLRRKRVEDVASPKTILSPCLLPPARMNWSRYSVQAG